MKKMQRIVVDWISNSNMEFVSAIIELEGSFEGIPNEVADAFEELSEKERIEVIKKSASTLLKRMS
ncbi:hypothetical protein QTG56_25620 (plasmid) [Rossellomorea sp. AcN35-11]|nr:hypothetical protein [Rossellomorea aquimaris]WJV31995.1 hypothetical protein QTG56_25620 [Rossellomorea sp. AcN35-11]